MGNELGMRISGEITRYEKYDIKVLMHTGLRGCVKIPSLIPAPRWSCSQQIDLEP